jgi:Amt family ammonium transporter
VLVDWCLRFEGGHQRRQQVAAQFVAALAAIALAVVGTIILLKTVDAIMGLRVNQAGELQGLDIHQHGEEGYIFL